MGSVAEKIDRSDAGPSAPSRVAIEVAGVEILCDRAGVAFMPDHSALIVSDLHLEKGAAFARRGMMLPPYDTAVTLDRLGAVLAIYRPKQVISLGDSFHDRLGAAHLPPLFAARLKAMMRGYEWYWVAGNHDPDRPDGLPGTAVDIVALGGLTLRHEPAGGTKSTRGEVAGHLHPVARVVRRGRGVRRACFASDGNRLVMPAFGATTGGLDLDHGAMRGLFDRSKLCAHLLGSERLYSVRYANLVA